MYQFLPIDSAMDLKVFSCEEDSLTTYLHRFALGNHKKGIATSIVCRNAEERIVGYYAFSMAQVAKESLPPQAATGIPNYPIGAIRIGRLARCTTVKGQGIGALLLRDCLRKIVKLGQTKDGSVPGFRFILVDAKNEKAALFYETYGFVRFVEKPDTLVLALSTVIAAAR